MNKFNKKFIFPILIIWIIITISMVFLLFNMHKEKNYWKGITAEHNSYHWQEINLTASKIENLGFNKETIKEMHPYINAKVFSSTTGLYPDFSGNSPYYAFLTTYYIPLAQDIASNQDLYGDNLKEAIDLFADTTKELKNLSRKILEITEDTKGKVLLVEKDSEIYNQVDKMIKDYCNEYCTKISNFNSSYKTTN